jgi:fructose-bisphosphate aldolase class I
MLLQTSCLKAWGGRKENVPKAQEVFYEMCKANSEAQYGVFKRVFDPHSGSRSKTTHSPEIN